MRHESKQSSRVTATRSCFDSWLDIRVARFSMSDFTFILRLGNSECSTLSIPRFLQDSFGKRPLADRLLSCTAAREFAVIRTATLADSPFVIGADRASDESAREALPHQHRARRLCPFVSRDRYFLRARQCRPLSR